MSLDSLTRRIVPLRYRSHLRPLYRQLRSWFYYGTAVHCLCCGRKARTFAPSSVQQSVKCPFCGSVPRHRLLAYYFRRRTLPGTTVLHIAPEPCLGSLLASLGFRVITADLAQRGVQVRLDVTRLPFGEASFDGVICNHVLEHVPDDVSALREICRVLRPGGWAVLNVPIQHQRTVTYEDWSLTTPEERLRAFGFGEHVRIYGRDYQQRCENAGLRTDFIYPAAELSEAERRQLGINAKTELHLCWR